MSVERNSKSTDPFLNAVRGLIRRMTVSKAGAVIWQLAGFRVGTSREVQSAEVFHGVGICAMPAKGGKPEAIMINVGGASAPVIIATRDEATRANVVPAGIKAGETCIYSEGAIVYLRNGTVEVRTTTGVALPLATKADVAALATFVNGLFVGGVASAVIPPGTVPQPTGTTVLKGE